MLHYNDAPKTKTNRIAARAAVVTGYYVISATGRRKRFSFAYHSGDRNGLSTGTRNSSREWFARESIFDSTHTDTWYHTYTFRPWDPSLTRNIRPVGGEACRRERYEEANACVVGKGKRLKSISGQIVIFSPSLARAFAGPSVTGAYGRSAGSGVRSREEKWKKKKEKKNPDGKEAKNPSPEVFQLRRLKSSWGPLAVPRYYLPSPPSVARRRPRPPQARPRRPTSTTAHPPPPPRCARTQRGGIRRGKK